jgi:hypothetical protein
MKNVSWRDFWKAWKFAYFPFWVEHLPWSYHVVGYWQEGVKNPAEWQHAMSTYDYGSIHHCYPTVHTDKEDPFIASCENGRKYRLWGTIQMEETFFADSFFHWGKHPPYTPRAETPNEHIRFTLTRIRGTKARRFRDE